jgi:hypothetical protein
MAASLFPATHTAHDQYICDLAMQRYQDESDVQLYMHLCQTMEADPSPPWAPGAPQWPKLHALAECIVARSLYLEAVAGTTKRASWSCFPDLVTGLLRRVWEDYEPTYSPNCDDEDSNMDE